MEANALLSILREIVILPLLAWLIFLNLRQGFCPLFFPCSHSIPRRGFPTLSVAVVKNHFLLWRDRVGSAVLSALLLPILPSPSSFDPPTCLVLQFHPLPAPLSPSNLQRPTPGICVPISLTSSSPVPSHAVLPSQDGFLDGGWLDGVGGGKEVLSPC